MRPLIVLFVMSCCTACHALVPPPLTPPSSSERALRQSVKRRGFIAAWGVGACLLFGGEEAKAATYLSGRNPNGKPKDPSDTKGTRKDPKFLRSLATCKSQCESEP